MARRTTSASSAYRRPRRACSSSANTDRDSLLVLAARGEITYFGVGGLAGRFPAIPDDTDTQDAPFLGSGP